MNSVGVKALYLTKLKDIAKKAKILNVTGIKAASYCESDGYINASLVMKFYFREAKKMGVKILEKTKVVDVLKENGQLLGWKLIPGKRFIQEHLSIVPVVILRSWNVSWGHIPIKASKRDLAVTRPLRFINYKFPVIEYLEEGWYFRPFRKFFIDMVLIGVAPSRWIEDKDRKPHPSFDWKGILTAWRYIKSQLPNLILFSLLTAVLAIGQC